MAHKIYDEQGDPHTEVSVTEARQGARRGVYRILMISTLLAVVALGAVWLGVGGRSHLSTPQTGPNGEAAASLTPANT